MPEDEVLNITVGHPCYGDRLKVRSLQEVADKWWPGEQVADSVVGANDGGGVQVTLLSSSPSANVIGRIYRYL